MKDVYLIDGSNITHANHNGTPLTANGMQVQAVFGVIRSLRAMFEKAPSDLLPIVLWDGKAQFRFDLYPDYKGNRDPNDLKAEQHRQAYQKQVPFLRKALELLGVAQVLHLHREADDLAAYFSDNYAAMGYRVTLISGDKDWIQLVKPGVTWYDPIRDRKVTHETLLDMTGYATVESFVDGKVLEGDTSDFIAGIEGMGPKTSQLFLAKWGTVKRFLEAVDAGDAEPTRRKSKKATSPHPEELLFSPEGRARYERNLQLMDLRAGPKISPADLLLTKKPANPEAFGYLCERLMFASLLRQMPQTLRAFGVKTPAPAVVHEPPPWEDQEAA
jgi:5'-3' exonuclease